MIREYICYLFHFSNILYRSTTKERYMRMRYMRMRHMRMRKGTRKKVKKKKHFLPYHLKNFSIVKWLLPYYRWVGGCCQYLSVDDVTRKKFNPVWKKENLQGCCQYLTVDNVYDLKYIYYIFIYNIYIEFIYISNEISKKDSITYLQDIFPYQVYLQIVKNETPKRVRSLSRKEIILI